jgi:hypothetical protein
VSRAARGLLLALFTLALVPASADAVPHKRLGATLGALWETVLETPTPDNPFAGGDPCVALGRHVVAPFAPTGTTTLTCTVAPGTKIFVAAWSSECSNLELDPYFGADEAALRACARAADADIDEVTITLDERPIRAHEVESRLLRLDLPADNILGAPAGPGGLSVAHGWVALLHPLPPGTHDIVLRATGTDAYGKEVDFTNTTTIVVARAP